MRPITLVQRSWFYFRIGSGTYLNFPLSFVSLILTFRIYLELVNIPGLSSLRTWQFTLVVGTPYVLVGILAGIIHIRKQQWAETEVMATQSPYAYKMVPVGKEAKLGTPMSLLDIRTRRAILQVLGILTPEFASELDKYEQMVLTLLQGGEVR